MPLANGSRIGPYEITGWIGAGGMGEVYRARDPRLGRDVAIKVIADGFATDAGRLQRFESEARAAGQLNHPNILAVYEAHEYQGRPVIVSELLEGQSLRDRLRGGVPLRKAIDYARQIAEGLAAAHDKSIVHRDLKPDNIFITNDGRIKILDFGLAKLTQPSDSATKTSLQHDTEPGTVLGTVGYMSPEQVRGEAVDARSDLFSFGTIFYEMLTGRSPFARNTPVESMSAILNDDPMPALAGSAPPAIEKIVSRCLEKSREARFQSARDLAFGLEVLTGSSLSNEAALVRTRSWWSPGRIATVVIAAILAAAAIAFVPLLRQAPPPAEPVRMTMELGSGMLLPPQGAQFGGLVAISPDGSLIAFTAQKSAEDRSNVIYVRALNELKARPLNGTESAYLPFFSPDGRWIGFFDDNSLLKVPTAGGPVQRLADAPDTRGGWWGADGNIVYVPDRVAGTVIWRVAADGGTPEPFTTLAEGESIHLFPQVLPGARAMVYTSSATPGAYNDSNIVIQTLPSGPRKVIANIGYHGRISQSGHLLFMHDGTLMAAPFDLDRLELLRPPVPAIPELRGNTITGGAQFSVSESGVLAYLPGPSVGGNTPMQLMDRQSTYTPIKGNLGNWLDLALSPDGGRAAMVIRDKASDIWIHDIARETTTRLTKESGMHSRPAWTPDGRRVVYAVSTGSQPAYMEWRPADGSGSPQRILTSTRNQVPSAFHPSGRYLAYEESTSETNVDLMVVPVEGDETTGWKFGTPRAIANGPAREDDAAFSADGKWVAFVSAETNRPEVYVQPFPELNRRWQISNNAGRSPVWSRARSEILYSEFGQLLVVGFTDRGGVFHADKPRPWAEGRVAFRGPSRMFDLLPDGNRVVLAPAPPPRTVDNARIDSIVLVLNYFEDLRRITSSQ